MKNKARRFADAYVCANFCLIVLLAFLKVHDWTEAEFHNFGCDLKGASWCHSCRRAAFDSVSGPCFNQRNVISLAVNKLENKLYFTQLHSLRNMGAPRKAWSCSTGTSRGVPFTSPTTVLTFVIIRWWLKGMRYGTVWIRRKDHGKEHAEQPARRQHQIVAMPRFLLVDHVRNRRGFQA